MPDQNSVSLSTILTQRIRNFGSDYAKASAPRSPHPNLTSNRIPDQSRLEWLRNRAKCNQFIGDIMTLRGYEMPRYRMSDGSEHYVNAENLRRFTAHFSTVGSLSELRPGDLLVDDYRLARGENGAHVEVVERINDTHLTSYGAHSDGAYGQTRPLDSLGKVLPSPR